MRYAISLGVSVVICILPHTATAQAGDPNRVVCPDVPRLQKFSVSSTEEASKRGMEVVNGNQCLKCSDHSIIVEKHTFSGTVTIETTRRCKTQADLDTYGCKAYCPNCSREPSVSLRLVADGKTESIASKSKCDERIGSAIRTAANSNSLSALAALRPAAEISRPASTGQPLSTSAVISQAFGGQAPPEVVKQAATDPGLQTAVALGEPGMIARAAKAAGLSEEQAQKLAADRASLTAIRPSGALEASEVDGVGYYSNYQPHYATTYNNQSASPFGMFSSLFSNGSLTSSLASLFKPTSEPIQSTSASPSNSSSELLHTIASLIVQPERISTGGSFIVSWTSLGTRRGEPCTLRLQDSANKTVTIGSAKEGTVRIPSTDLARGKLLFTLSCPSPQGNPLTLEKRVELQ